MSLPVSAPPAQARPNLAEVICERLKRAQAAVTRDPDALAGAGAR